MHFVLTDSKYCKDGWKYYKEHCYKLITEEDAIQWGAAEQSCDREGGHLVSILDKYEMAFVHNLLVNVWKVNRKRIYIGNYGNTYLHLLVIGKGVFFNIYL